MATLPLQRLENAVVGTRAALLHLLPRGVVDVHAALPLVAVLLAVGLVVLAVVRPPESRAQAEVGELDVTVGAD